MLALVVVQSFVHFVVFIFLTMKWCQVKLIVRLEKKKGNLCFEENKFLKNVNTINRTNQLVSHWIVQMNIGGELSVDLCTGLSDKCKVDVRMHSQTNKNNIETTTIINEKYVSFLLDRSLPRSLPRCARPARSPWCRAVREKWELPSCPERSWPWWRRCHMWWRTWPESTSPR